MCEHHASIVPDLAKNSKSLLGLAALSLVARKPFCPSELDLGPLEIVAELLHKRQKLRPISDRRRSHKTAGVSRDVKWIWLQRIWDRPERFDNHRDQEICNDKHRRCPLVELQSNDENLDFAI